MNDVPNRDAAIFTEALKLPVGERVAYLELACEGDVQLRRKVEILLEISTQMGDFLEISPRETSIAATPETSVGEKPGDHIGRFKLLQQIGEGGCGVVFMAEQEEPVRRQVALKIIKPGMDSKTVIARFEAERQALALMDHPNIAKIFEAGATTSGRPYFVMELVRGIKITEYCDQHSLITQERLRLFIQVCQAVQHAHQKGIIHRDIKPSNILVTTTLEGAALPVVIDFGIAKATTNQRLTDKTLFTAFEMLIGTPAYMSPEQAALKGADVDTRTDIYSLGVLLYELVAGSTPFDTSELMASGLDEIRRVIREQEPVRPSTRLSKLDINALTTLAQHRKSEPPILIRAVRGDLDWIAMKALEKDRTRRYETANGLAADVQRYLGGEPISARPPSKVYKFQKAVLRNKLLFTGVGVIALLLVVGLILVSASLAKERRSRHEADMAARAAETEKANAQTEAIKSGQVTKFLQDMLQSVGPAAARGRDTTMLREVLDQTADRVGREMTNQPAVEAELRNLIGTLYFQIGRYDRAEEMHRAALAARRKLFGRNSSETADSLNNLGLTLMAERKLPEAEAIYGQALAIRRRIFGEENAQTVTSLNDLSAVYRDEGRLVEAEPLARQALAIREKLFGKNRLEVADSLRNVSVILGDGGKWSESEMMAREVLAIRTKLLGPEHPWVASALNDVAWAAGAQGKLDEAETLEREALAMRRKLLPEEHPEVANSLNLIGDTMRKQGNLSQAYSVLNAALSIQRKLLGDENSATLGTMKSMGLTLESENKWPEAEALFREALASWRKRAGEEDPQTLFALRDLASAFQGQGKWSEAEVLHREALNVWRKRGGDEDPEALYTMHMLGLALQAEKKWPEAIAIHREALDLWRKRISADDPQTLYATRNLAEALEGAGRWPEAEALHRETLAQWRKRLGNEDPQTLYTLNRLGLTLEAQGKLAEAEEAHGKVIALWQNGTNKDQLPPWSEMESMTRVLVAEKKFHEAERLLDISLTPTITQQPANVALLDMRVDLRSRAARWQDAAADATIAFQHEPANYGRFPILAGLLARTKNRSAYEQFCKKILAAFANTSDIYAADQVAKSCLFLPSSELDLKVIGRLIDAAVTQGTNDGNALPFFQDCKALLEYRQGHYAEAVEWAQKPLEIPGIYVHGHAYGVLAMAFWKMGKEDQARAMLMNGNTLEPPDLPVEVAADPSNAWQAWLFSRIQLDEAAALIQSSASTNGGLNKP
jgi:serine/threonine protein kinase/tetratricopeptide (TPR) repeat protein